MSDLIIHCSKGRIKVIGHSVEAFGENRDNFFFQVKGYKWIKDKWAKQDRYYNFEGYSVEGVHVNELGANLH